MNPTPTTRGALRRWSAALFLLPLLLAASPAFAQDPVVTAADPDMAEQETYDLVVKITGNNFGVDSQVDFYVAGTTDSGGIRVKNVKRKNPKTLEATIDVAPDAAVQLFDIQVRTNGRTGKGTELFRVLEKTTGVDTTPPGDIEDLSVVGVGFNRIDITWTAPAEDGATGGPALAYHVNVRTDGPVTLDNWSSAGVNWIGPEPPGQPGSRETGTLLSLLPETYYYIALRAVDERDNWSGLSNALELATESVPAAAWTYERVASCAPAGNPSLGNEDFEYDLDHQPAILYLEDCGGSATPTVPRLARRTADGHWASESLPEHVGNGDDLAFDPITGAATIASSNWANYDRQISGTLTLYRQTGSTWSAETVDTKLPVVSELVVAYSGGVPYIAYPVELKGNKRVVRLAEWTGGGWSRHEFPATVPRHLVLAFDSAGRPAIAYREAQDESFRFALWTGTSWVRETVEPASEGEICGLAPSLVWDPVRDRFTAAHNCVASNYYDSDLRVCQRPVSGAWSCSTALEEAGEPVLAVAADGVLTMAYYAAEGSVMLATSPDGGATWSPAEVVDWNTSNATHLRLDPLTGEPTLSYFAGSHPEPELLFAHRP